MPATFEPSLVLREASGAERVFSLAELPQALSIGRDQTCTISVQSPFVSRQHARIEGTVEAPVLVDLGSRNGSLLNGARVQGSAPLADGDVIGIGDATIRCVFAARESEQTRTLAFRGGQRAEVAAETAPEAGEEAASASAPADALRVDAQTYEVAVGGQPLAKRLSSQEFQLLRYLFEHHERVCTRQELGDSIWGRDNWDPNMLHRLVHRLKEKLEPNPERPRYVQTVPWVGYRLTP
jgi:hypothetical protein